MYDAVLKHEMKTTGELIERAKKLRRDTLELGTKNGGYHFGGSFSAVEILIALYDVIMIEEDRFILSKGHGCWPLYVLLRERGFNPELAGHPSLDVENGIYCTTGSEGHGLPNAIGRAWARKLEGRPGRVFVMIGDGECQEGTTWESMLLAPFRGVDNLTVIVDYNRIQGSGFVSDILPIDSLAKVASLLGWSVEEIDGHSFPAVIDALQRTVEGTPRFIVARTVKGKGVSYMEDKPAWHAKFPTPDQLAQAYQELA